VVQFEATFLMRDNRSTDSLDYLPTDGKTGIVGTAIKSFSAILSFSLIAGIVIWSWRLGMRDTDDLPVIKALEGPARTQPEDPGGTEAAHQGLEVNGVLANNEAPPVNGQASLAPPATELTEEDAAQAVLNGGEAAVAETGVAPEAESVESLIANLGPETGAETGAESGTAVIAEEAPVVDEQERLASIRPQPRPDDLVTTIEPGEEVFTAVEPEAVAPAAVEPPVKPGDRLIQLGAFDTQEIAEQQWQAVLQANADLLGDKQYLIQEATSGGRIFYRLRVYGFAGLDESRALCSALQPREVPCIPVTAR
jgi:hypothetical protein